MDTFHGTWPIAGAGLGRTLVPPHPFSKSPNQSVAVSDRPTNTIGTPSQVIRDNSEIFCQGLHRLHLDLLLDGVPELTVWLNTSRIRAAAPCVYCPVQENRALLLDSLDSAPLEVLVLDGVKRCSLLLVERIIQRFPDLLGLTLFQRDSKVARFGRTRLSVWSRQSGEYALLFRGSASSNILLGTFVQLNTDSALHTYFCTKRLQRRKLEKGQ